MATAGIGEVSLAVNLAEEKNRALKDWTDCLTRDGSVDRRGKPARKDRTGGWKLASILLVNYGLATLAFFGVDVNLVLFFTRVMQQDSAGAANNVSKWTGTMYLFSLIGAFMSDSYWGRYLTCTIFQLIFVLGLMLLSLTSHFLLVRPTGCGDRQTQCSPVSLAGTSLFYLSIYMIALGNGGYMPAVATFGSDQFDENDPRETKSKVTFFSWFYFALNLGSILSNTLLAYVEDSGKWTIGFWTSSGAAAAALLLFWAGTPWYRHFKPCGNPLTRICQVLVAAVRKCGVAVPENENELYEVEGKESAIAGSRKIRHTQDFRCLDKAATLTPRDYNIQKSPWRLCTVTQVEEVKAVLRMLPIWLYTIIYSVVFTQMASLFVEQGESMSNTVGRFHVPPASMTVFDPCCVLIGIFLYDRILVPIANKLSSNPRGLSELQRMGIGLILGMLAVLVAGIVEIVRLQRVVGAHQQSSLSILWQIPQYTLIGASEVFMYIGQLEFFNGQAPDSVKSFGSSLFMASISFGNYVNSMLVAIVMTLTSSQHDNKPGWIPDNLNNGHVDRFFVLLAALTFLDFVIYLFCTKRYNYNTRGEGEELGDDGDGRYIHEQEQVQVDDKV